MAAVLVLLVVLDTFLTGYELYRARMVKRDISCALDSLHDLMVWRGYADTALRDSGRVPAPPADPCPVADPSACEV